MRAPRRAARLDAPRHAGLEDGGPFLELRPFLRDGGLRQGTWGYEIYDELTPAAEDWYVEKRASARSSTRTSRWSCAASAPRPLLIAGVLTNQCIAATSKDALFRDFKPIVVEECTGTTLPHLHEPAIEMIRVGWGEVNGARRDDRRPRAGLPAGAA